MKSTVFATLVWLGAAPCPALPPEPVVAAGDAARATDARPRLVAQVGHTSGVTAVAPSPDGRLLATASADHTARLWDLATGAELRRFAGHSLDVTGAAFTPDGRRVVTASADTTVRVWDAATGAELMRFSGDLGPVTSVAVSPDGRSAVAGSFDGSVKRLDLATGRQLAPYAGSPDRVGSVAYSPDGRFVAAGAADGAARLWDAATGELLRTFVGHEKGWVKAVAFSPDGRSLLTGGGDRTARLWDAATGAERRRLAGHAREVASVAFSPDGRVAMTAATDGARLWDAATGAEVGRLEKQQSVACLAPTPDGRFVVTGSYDGGAWLWDVAAREPVRAYFGNASMVRGVAFSPDGALLMVAGDDTARLWGAATGAPAPLGDGVAGRVLSLAASPDGRYVLAAHGDRTVRLWDAATRAEVRRFVASHAGHGVAFSPDGRYVLTGGSSDEDTAAHVYEAATGRPVRELAGHRDGVSDVAVSADGRLVLTADGQGDVLVFDAASGARLRGFSAGAGPVMSLAVSPDGRRAVTAGVDGSVRVWDPAAGAEVRRLGAVARPAGQAAAEYVDAAVFSPDGRYVLTGGGDGVARLWDVATGAETGRFEGHTDAVFTVAFSPDGRFVVTGSFDATTRVWDRATGRELCQLIAFRDGTWVAADPEGRFDTNNLDEIRGLHWMVPDDPFTALPLEIFMRDYYEPRLLSRVLAGDHFGPVRPVAGLNRARPLVRILEAKISPEGDRYTVKVEVSATTSKAAGGRPARASGAYDLRLFRDGQLVGASPRREGEGGAAPDDLGAWRRATAIDLDPATGSAVFTFRDVQFARGPQERALEFSAYAFNEDRVKSATARHARRLKPAAAPAARRAYLVTVGVNAYETPRLDLSFAANDARRLRAAVAAGLERSGEFAEVVQVELVSDRDRAGGGPAVAEKTATKANLKAVLDLLAGRPVDPAVVAAIPGAASLRRATPHDLVVVSFSGHGYADRDGRFFLVPYDTGAAPEGEPTGPFLRRLVSSDELGEWLRDVDAGDMALIVDACHSAAAVEGGGFKPGPMGSRGLGQLAYDKGMRVLAATQADNVALESNRVQQGLLTYALTREGLEARRADFKPKDATIWLSEWLAYGGERVPWLFEEVRAGRPQPAAVEQPRLVGEGADAARALVHARPGAPHPRTQQPALFDFTRTRRDVLLAR